MPVGVAVGTYWPKKTMLSTSILKRSTSRPVLMSSLNMMSERNPLTVTYRLLKGIGFPPLYLGLSGMVQEMGAMGLMGFVI